MEKTVNKLGQSCAKLGSNYASQPEHLYLVVFQVKLFDVVFHLQKDLRLSSICKNILGRLSFQFF
jgi:hypothetical protein